MRPYPSVFWMSKSLRKMNSSENRVEVNPRSSLLAPHSFQPPSRYDNPFATCWTRPGALEYRFSGGQTAERLVGKLASQNWQGAIVGPHGSGKSTLLETLQPALRAAGRRIFAVALRDGQRHLPRACLSWSHDQALVIVDGYEQLAWLERVRLERHCRRAKLALLVTAHEPIRIPLLVRLDPNRQLVRQLVADLAARVSTPITTADVAASHDCHGSNVREIFFDLYDRHERLRRGGRSDGFGGA